MKSRTIEIWRLIASILIMATHLFVIEAQNSETPFFNAWIYVEFFYFLTGYFTYRHFCNIESKSIDEAARNALSYVLKKYIRFLPFVVIISLFQYMIEFISLGSRLSNFLNIPYEVLLITEAFPIEECTHILPFWYLSAMMIVLPLICLLCQMRNKHLTILFGVLMTTIYYGFFGYSGLNVRGFPFGVLRAFSGIMMGMLICILVNKLGHSVSDLLGKRSLLIAWSSFLLTIIFSYYNLSAMRSYVILFIIAIFFAMCSYENYNNINYFRTNWLADMSLGMFLWHYTVGTIIRLYIPIAGYTQKIVVYYLITIIVSVLSILIRNMLRR